MKTWYSNASTASVAESSSRRRSVPEILVITRLKRPGQVALEIVMTKGDRHRIGDVGGLRRSGERELAANRLLNLTFGCAAVARQQPLDLRGGIALHRNAGLRRREADDAASVAHKNRRPRSFVVGI